MSSPAVRHALRALALVLLVAFPLGCGTGGKQTEQTVRQPMPPPEVTLSAEEQQVWAPGATPPGIPTLLYHGIGTTDQFVDPADAAYAITRENFAKQMALLQHAGYHTVTLAQLSAYVSGHPEQLPSRPLLITFDDGLASSWLDGDGALKREGFTATMFVDAGRVSDHAQGYLTWDELKTMQSSGRWDIQLHAWQGHRMIRFGPGENDYGAFYAYREEHESLEGWRQRAFGDISEGASRLHKQLPAEQAVAFAPPYGNYGQEGTNDSHIPTELLSWLLDRYQIVFVQNRCIFSSPHEEQPLGRFQISHSTTGGELHAELSKAC